MLEELDTLEAKIVQLLEYHRVLRDENMRLRQQVVAMENANKLLSDRLDDARSRMENLYNSLPE